jgi:hypothetical protein
MVYLMLKMRTAYCDKQLLLHLLSSIGGPPSQINGKEVACLIRYPPNRKRKAELHSKMVLEAFQAADQYHPYRYILH